jgi:hypothetical protein
LEIVMQTQTTTQALVISHDARQALLQATVDKLAEIKAQIAELRQQENELKQVLIDSGESAVDSLIYRATIADVQGKEIVDWRAVAEKFNPSRQLIRAYTSRGENYFMIRVVARKTS